MDMQVIITQLAVLFILLAAGYTAGRVKFLTPDDSKMLTKIVINITAPCTIITSVMGGELSASGGETALFMLFTFLAFLLYLVIALPASRALGGDKRNVGLYGYMAGFGNAAFMGFPVTIAIFGAASAYYVALYNIPFMILTFSVGIVLISGKGKKIGPRELLNPTIFAAILAIIMMMTGINTPTIISEVIRLTGGVTTPASMLVVGSTLAQIPLKSVFSEWRLYPMALLKLIVMPVAAWLVFRNIITNELMLGVLVILSGMPVAVLSAMIAIKYGGNEHIASSGIFITTLLSIVTIPLIVYLLLM